MVFQRMPARAKSICGPATKSAADELTSDLNWINRNPFLQSNILMAPGGAPGTTDLMLRTQDRFPLRVYAGFENSGNQFTGDERILTGFNYGNLFGLGQQLSYQFTSGEDVNKFTRTFRHLRHPAAVETPAHFLRQLRQFLRQPRAGPRFRRRQLAGQRPL